MARAADLVDCRVVTVPRGWTIRRALARAKALGAAVVAADGRTAARTEDLERAAAWQLERLRWRDLAWGDLPSVPAGAGEIAVRRLFQAGAALVLVREGRRVIGAIAPPRRAAGSLAAALERLHGAEGEARLWLLRAAGKLAEAQGHGAYAAGGLVRDLLLGRGAAGMPDVDLVVEGDGIAFGRQLAEETGGHLVVHPAFGTASLEGGATPDGTRIGRVDIATARRERYPRPGALPEVGPAGIDEDLARRDFTVNAMAVALAPAAWGRLLDPFGGERDVAARRLRVLHPLSFVEDPTRIFRGARYAARLGFRPDAGVHRAMALALRVADYPALSGQRLYAELELVMQEPDPWRALRLLLDWGALALWDRGFRATRRGRSRLESARALMRWAHGARVAVDPAGLTLLSLLFDQTRPVADRAARRLAVAGALATQMDAAAARALGRRLAGAARWRPSRVADTLRPAGESTLLGAWLSGGAAARRAIGWFLAGGRAARPVSSGDDVIAAGVPRGPRVAQALGMLRDLRLDGRVRTREDERAAVADWIEALTTKGDLR